VLLVDNEGQHYKSVLTIFNGNERDARALEVAAQLARAAHKTLLVLIPADGTPDYQQRQEQARQSLGQNSLAVRYQAVTGMEASFNQKIIQEEVVGMVVLSAAGIDLRLVENRLAKLECSILLVP
jgi:hypothetical protein